MCTGAGLFVPVDSARGWQHMSTTHPLEKAAAELAAKIATEQQAKPEPTVFDDADRIVVGTPCYGGSVKQEFMTSYFDAMSHVSARFRDAAGQVEMRPLIAESLFLDKESHIDRARNKIANKFMRGSRNWLMFIDADIVFTALAVGRLWQHGMNGNSLCAAPYALKGIVPQFAVNGEDGAKPDERGLLSVVHAGTGFMLIHRSVFEKLEAAGLAPEYKLGSNDPDVNTHKTNRAYFKSGVREVDNRGAHWLSEDYMLCHEWRGLGGKIMLDTKIALEHIGDLKYPINAVEAFAAVRELRRIKHPACPADLV